ncbi:Predicted ATPase [Rhizobium sp. RU35A]|uniref:ATP-binding protein n=1 Tax=Rhizobium sp. RU35A TaxID=1907414 RepID=UPI000956941B|nr:winged helix-turn-helix domain-containing protein [Rhizobium sp. RU35A]SIQ94743.1 Predicted ATPase [Rhizobium sp. RU35A]
MNHCPRAPIMLSDRFCLSISERTLYRDGEPVRIGARALEILLVLAEQPGALVSKNELLSRVWPQQFVDETALRVHLSMLRRLLASDGDERRRIVNENGRGYRLVLPTGEPEVSAPTQRGSIRSTLPVAIASMLGRDEMVARASELMATRRLLSLCGPGGVGKTTLALAVATAFSAAHAMPALFVDLSALGGDPASLYAALARQVLPGGEPVDGWAVYRLHEAVTAPLRAAPLLIVLDNCEHVIDAAAAFAEGLLATLPHLVILATSREPLRAAGEWVLQVPPLGLPPEGAPSAPVQLRQSPAIRLFIERAQAVRPDFNPATADLAAIGRLCHQLDGLPLAIEMAAARLATSNLAELTGLLQGGLSTLTHARRTAPERHRSLAALAEWSLDLLSAAERDVFERLCVFCGPFSLKDALGVLEDARDDVTPLMDAIAALVARSLVVAQQAGGETRYRILKTLRGPGLARLANRSAGRAAMRQVCRAHARHVLTEARRGTAQARSIGTFEPVPALLEEMRAALAWASGPEGDSALAAALVVSSSRLLRELSMPFACLDLRGTKLACLSRSVGVTGPPPRLVETRRPPPPGPFPGRPRGDPPRLFEPRLILADLG